MQMSIKWARQLHSLMFLLLFASALIVTYSLFLQETNEYMGYKPIDMSIEYWLRVLLFIFIFALMMPGKVTRPSDFFLLFYGSLVVVPYSILHPILGSVALQNFLMNMAILLLPWVTVSFIANIGGRIRFPSLISTETAFNIVLIAALAGTAYLFLNAPGSAGFDLTTAHIRRLEARDIFTDRSMGAYASSMTMNGFLPIIAFYAGWKNRRTWLGIALLCATFFWYSLGSKAHVIMIGLGWLLGRGVRFNRLSRIREQLGRIVMFLFAAFFVEYILFEYSYVADYLLRRLFSVPSSMLSAYFDLINNPLQSWRLWSGIVSTDGVTFLVGELYLNDPQANANTNGFIHKLAENGVLIYFATILLVGIVFKVIDSCYVTKKSGLFMGLGLFYAILLVEQSATTALLSSGVGPLLLLFMISSEPLGNDSRMASSAASKK